ncbi:hypothetical protein ACKKBG_A06895 [Auxenochlorella protothecoides x Auxenochlorella symbiontica]
MGRSLPRASTVHAGPGASGVPPRKVALMDLTMGPMTDLMMGPTMDLMTDPTKGPTMDPTMDLMMAPMTDPMTDPTMDPTAGPPWVHALSSGMRMVLATPGTTWRGISVTTWLLVECTASMTVLTARRRTMAVQTKMVLSAAVPDTPHVMHVSCPSTVC